jgi:hypothetical protein
LLDCGQPDPNWNEPFFLVVLTDGFGQHRLAQPGMRCHGHHCKDCLQKNIGKPPSWVKMHDKANACMTDQTGPHLVVEVAILQSCLIFAKEILAVGSDEAESDLLMQTIHACQEKNHRLVFSKASAKKHGPAWACLSFSSCPNAAQYFATKSGSFLKSVSSRGMANTLTRPIYKSCSQMLPSG